MRNATWKMLITVLISLLILAVCMGLGSVQIDGKSFLAILAHKLFGGDLPAEVDAAYVSILWSIRMPRAVSAFLVGAMLSLSGAVMQAVLQNPLASSYTLGVSSGASLGAAIIITMEITVPVLGAFLLPATGFLFGFVTVFLVLTVSARLDRNVTSHTVILFGMVVSLFTNALMTVLSALRSTHSTQLLMWQMGSFSGRRWYHVSVLAVTLVICFVLLFRYHRELDIMTFGDESSLAVGVNTGSVKYITLILAAVLTGVAVCFTGTIGFVDLVVPHVVRRLFGAAHKKVLVMSVFVGGLFLSLADLAARTILAPKDMPVGAVTALIGAPFFVWIFFFGMGRREERV